MARRYFLPLTESELVAFYANFAGVLGLVAARVGITPEEVETIRADEAYFRFVCNSHRDYTATTKALTIHKNDLREGKPLGAFPEPVSLSSIPPAVPDAPLDRLRDLCARIKRHPGYTDTIGEQLGILGSEVPALAPSVKPRLTVKIVSGRPVVQWAKNGLDAVEIEVDRNTGTFVPLGIRVTPRYTDTAPPPPAPALWRYRAIFRKKDETVGDWSEVASVWVLS